ncbi:2-hydroxyacid dehydrogenase [Paraburkholderia sp. MPAMCS5]|uniref:2-hydroxyacid dehydrogenase n=1 Tax=Paraburkholderia sp. MPAMCS5 TaxID=3112563 RepID=UPI002E183EA0|nr:2-hydroxyacid dehydrogenase [Paraburkholderia sp. MPAMCS5]
MERKKVLRIGVFHDELQRVMDDELQCYSDEEIMEDAALRAQIGAIITRSNYRISPELLDQLPMLSIIATAGVGYDGIPVAAARERGIVVTNTPGVLDSAVCELAVGLLLAMVRKIPAMDQYVRSGAWKTAPYALTTGLAGKRIGIVGLGRIGRGIADRLIPFGVEIAYTGREQGVSYGHFSDVQQLAHYADVLILSCPGGPATHHLVNAEVLKCLGSEGFLVNVARGSVVDETALAAALQDGVIRGAALDVFESEPLIESPLLHQANVVLAPHAGSATEETRRTMLRITLDNIHRVLDGHEALTPV